jgi:hypothetical protein
MDRFKVPYRGIFVGSFLRKHISCSLPLNNLSRSGPNWNDKEYSSPKQCGRTCKPQQPTENEQTLSPKCKLMLQFLRKKNQTMEPSFRILSSSRRHRASRKGLLWILSPPYFPFYLDRSEAEIFCSFLLARRPSVLCGRLLQLLSSKGCCSK